MFQFHVSNPDTTELKCSKRQLHINVNKAYEKNPKNKLTRRLAFFCYSGNFILMT